MKNIFAFTTMAVLALTLVTNSFAALVPANTIDGTGIDASGKPLPAPANTNSLLSQAATSAKQVVATNINQVMIEMLTGVKNASGDIYKFSKQEIGQGYDFIKAQAPEVVKEFLAWQIAKGCVWIAIFGSVACLLFYFARQMKLRAPESRSSEDDLNILKWIGRVIACVILIVTLGINGMVIAKIVVAPRVFIIEYVVDLCNGNTQNAR